MFFAPALRATRYVPRTFDRGFERFAAHAFPAAQRALHVEQDDKLWTLRLDLPGLAREHLRIDIEGAVVRIETQDDAPRPFKAAYEMPLAIDAATSEAKLENGVLTLKLAKVLPVRNVTSLTIG